MSSPPAGDVQRLLETMQVGVPEGRVPARIFNDQAVYERERERVFGRVWCFLAHESEVPKPGDYVTRYIADNNVIVARTERGDLKASLNMCRHRGNMMCKSEMGNSSHFRCSYHGWVYKNSGELIGVPYFKEGYESKLDRKQWGLVPVRTETYAGLVFGTLDPDAEPLEEYLGGFQFYLDIYLKQGPGGSVVHGPPDHWVAETDWKICVENFSGDGYHTPVAHQFGFHLGYFPSSGATHSQGWAAHIPGKGHGIGLGHTPGMPPFAGYPPELVAQMGETLSPAQMEVFSKTRTAVGSVFPNLSFLIQPFSLVPGEPGVRFCTMRLYHPTGPGRMEMWSWCLVPAAASDEYKEAAYKAYTLAFGQAGMFEQDDFENWTRLTRVAGSSVAKHLEFPYVMGIEREPLSDFPGPGHVVSPYVTDTNFRGLWGTYTDYMLKES
ncbi:aromatic ring-hydroxylating oxygenase subunit alpha [Nocardioides humi]|uniref:Aromatic ring-hydroxylating dioxygenase subunit alpha n=1 Tax=Nocardioides humi TaxID=449461 RepID=A0ABN2AF65_9ACTN|nr:aromatic ring-hydroxylating dioxygenase subunit alpha [Nocardioides humi]